MAAGTIKDYSDDLTVAVAENYDLAEGPVWDTRSQTLLYVDGFRGDLHCFDPVADEVRSIRVGETIGTALPAGDDGFVVTCADGVKAVTPDGKSMLLAGIETDRPGNRMNDAKCDSRGRLWGGTFSTRFEPGAGSLYRIDADGTAKSVLSGVRVSNGIGWNADESHFYYVDTLSRGIDVFDYDIEAGSLSNRRRFVEIDREDGLPDGLTVDAEGCVWVALFHGGQVRRYDPAGRLTGILRLPVSRVTSCNFGGPEYRDLYVTTADFRLHDDGRPHEPKAGYLFRCQPGVEGLPSYAFGG